MPLPGGSFRIVEPVTLESLPVGEDGLILFAGDIGNDEMKGLIEQSGLNPLMRPAEPVNVEAIPEPGSGKNDFNRAKQLATEACA